MLPKVLNKQKYHNLVSALHDAHSSLSQTSDTGFQCQDILSLIAPLVGTAVNSQHEFGGAPHPPYPGGNNAGLIQVIF